MLKRWQAEMFQLFSVSDFFANSRFAFSAT